MQVWEQKLDVKIHGDVDRDTASIDDSTRVVSQIHIDVKATQRTFESLDL
jgi:hypothetical protein